MRAAALAGEISRRAKAPRAERRSRAPSPRARPAFQAKYAAGFRKRKCLVFHLQAADHNRGQVAEAMGRCHQDFFLRRCPRTPPRPPRLEIMLEKHRPDFSRCAQVTRPSPDKSRAAGIISLSIVTGASPSRARATMETARRQIPRNAASFIANPRTMAACARGFAVVIKTERHRSCACDQYDAGARAGSGFQGHFIIGEDMRGRPGTLPQEIPGCVARRRDARHPQFPRKRR